MHRVARMAAGLGILMACGCAAMSGSSASELLFVVETPVDLGRLEFGSDGGIPFVLANAQEGTTIFRRRVPAGEYCLAEVVFGNLSVGSVLSIPRPICVRGEAGQQIYGGHLVSTRRGLERVVSWPRLKAQLESEAVVVDARPKSLADRPFPVSGG